MYYIFLTALFFLHHYNPPILTFSILFTKIKYQLAKFTISKQSLNAHIKFISYYGWHKAGKLLLIKAATNILLGTDSLLDKKMGTTADFSFNHLSLFRTILVKIQQNKYFNSLIRK